MVQQAEVVSETIGDETIVLDMRSGTFYALRGLASELWIALGGGLTPGAAIDTLSAAWGPAPELASVRTFLSELAERDLLTAVDAAPGTAAARLAAQPAASAVLEVHEDLTDLMLLDPVHDVTPQGWPTTATDAAPSLAQD